MTDTFSSNGTDPGAYAIASDIDGGEQGEGGGFLSDLAKAMQATAAAEQARDAEVTEQRRKAHLDSIRAREAIEAEDLRELAKEDVKGIDAWSDGEIKRIKLERERRIASRREQLQIRLEEHRWRRRPARSTRSRPPSRPTGPRSPATSRVSARARIRSRSPARPGPGRRSLHSRTSVRTALVPPRWPRPSTRTAHRPPSPMTRPATT